MKGVPGHGRHHRPRHPPEQHGELAAGGASLDRCGGAAGQGGGGEGGQPGQQGVCSRCGVMRNKFRILG